MILNSQQPAPYKGVLINPDHFKELIKFKAESQELYNNLDKYIQCAPSALELKVNASTTIELTLLTLLIGLAGGLYLGKHGG